MGSNISTFTKELGDQICELLGQGMTLREIEQEIGVPRSTISDWGHEPKHSDEAFIGQYARATEKRARAQFAAIEELERRMMLPRVIETIVEGKTVKMANPDWLDPHAGRVVVDSMKWRLSKMLPKVYGDRAHLELGGEVKTTATNQLPEHLAGLIDQTDPVATANAQDEDTVH